MSAGVSRAGGAGGGFEVDRPVADPTPEVTAIGDARDPIRSIPWRAEIRALIDIEDKLLDVTDGALATLRALARSPFDFRGERARLLAEKDPGLEVKVEDGRQLSTSAGEGGRHVRLVRPHGMAERPVDHSELTIPREGRIEVSLGVHDSRGPLGFRNADLVARTLAECGAITDAAERSPLAREDRLTGPRLGLLEADLGQAAAEAARLERLAQEKPALLDLRKAYRAALDAKSPGDANDRAFEAATLRVVGALPTLGLAPADAALVRDELELCRAIRDKWVGWFEDTGRVRILPV